MRRWVAIGIALVAVGAAVWLARSAWQPPAGSRAPDDDVITAAPASLTAAPPSLRPTTSPGHPRVGASPESVPFSWATASADELSRRRDLAGGLALDRAAVDVLIARLRATGAAGDAGLFRVLVELLGQANDPHGDAALIALLADVTTELPARVGALFSTALRDTTVPGAAAAAKVRIEKSVSAGHGRGSETVGWFDLVAAQGLPDDLPWLLATGIAIDARGQALEALARAPRPATIEVITNEFREGRGNPYAFDALAKAAPAELPALATAALTSDVQSHDFRKSDIFRHYARHATVDRLPDVEAMIRAQTSDEDRIAAVYGIEELRRRGWDTTRLRPADEAAIAFMDRIANGEPVTGANRPLLNRAAYAIASNPTTWNERAASVLERAADTLDRAGVSAGGPNYPELAKEIREALKSPSK